MDQMDSHILQSEEEWFQHKRGKIRRYSIGTSVYCKSSQHPALELRLVEWWVTLSAGSFEVFGMLISWSRYHLASHIVLKLQDFNTFQETVDS